MKLLDVAGLTLGDWQMYAPLLGLPADVKPILPEERLPMLLRLREGAGVTIYTGPWGKDWWGLVSREVNVEVVPDGYRMGERLEVAHWSYMAAGATAKESAELARRALPPTPRHRLYDVWTRAMGLQRLLVPATPLVEEAFPISALTEAEGRQLLDNIHEPVALDWEWNRETHHPFGLSVATGDRTWYISGGQALRASFSELVRRETTFFHNGRSDIGLMYDGDPVELVGKPIHDTLVMAYNCAAGETWDLGLKPLTRRFLDREPRDYPEDLETLPLAQQARYAGADARNTFDLFGALMPVLVGREQQHIYFDIDRPLVPIIASMEKYGSPIDMEECRRLHRDFQSMERAMVGLIWERFHIDITEAAGVRALIQKLTGYDPGTIDQRVIAKFEDPWMDVVIGYRKCRTLRRNYLEKYIERWEAAGYPAEFRLYPRFNQAGRETDGVGEAMDVAPGTGRMSSSGPNFQQQGRNIRSIFTAPPGQKFWTFDYAQGELRLAASISRDPAMLRAFGDDPVDLHEQLRQRTFQVSGQLVDRPVAKQFNFEQLYFGGATTGRKILALARSFISQETAEDMVRAHASLFPVYRRTAEERIAEAVRRGYAETLDGRRRYLAGLHSVDPTIRGNALRGAGNHGIQGTLADLIKKSTAKAVPLWRTGAHHSIQAHDELCGWVTEGQEKALVEGMREAMYVEMEVPLVAEGHVGRNWAEAKE